MEPGIHWIEHEANNIVKVNTDSYNFKDNIMQMTFRVDCPKCNWGHIFKDSYINQGFLQGKCDHCGNKFYFKITVMGVQVEVEQGLPEDSPCTTLPEAR